MSIADKWLTGKLSFIPLFNWYVDTRQSNRSLWVIFNNISRNFECSVMFIFRTKKSCQKRYRLYIFIGRCIQKRKLPKKVFKIIFWLSTQACSTGTGNERLKSKKMNCQNSINTFRELANNNRTKIHLNDMDQLQCFRIDRILYCGRHSVRFSCSMPSVWEFIWRQEFPFLLLSKTFRP